MTKSGRIYGIRDILKNKIVYIGKTITQDDYTPHGKHIKKLFNKYPDRYVYTIIEENINETALDEKEKFYIKQYNTYTDKECFNYTEGGGGGDTFSKLPENIKERCVKKRVLSNKLTKSTEVYKQKIIPIWKSIGENSKRCLVGRKLSQEHKQKIADGVRKTMKDPVMHDRISHKGIPKPTRSNEHRKNISLAMKGKPKSEEHKLKIKAQQQGKRKITNGERRSWLFVNQKMPEGWQYV